MKTLVFVDNVAEPHLAKSYECEDLLAQIKELLPVWPKTARIYHNDLALSADVTPTDFEGVERLKSLDGKFYILLYPEDPLTAAILVVGILVGVAAVLLLPKLDVPNALGRNVQSTSPNNALSDRSNQARPKGRIPDIYGQVRSTPDLIALPYKVFKENIEFEINFMCVGRGSYEISDIRDDTTRISQIPGSSVEVYGPGTSPNSGSPQVTVGSPIDFPLVAAKRTTAVNGQTLNPSDGINVFGVMRFVYPNKIQLVDTNPVKFTEKLIFSDTIDLKTSVFYIPSGTIINITKSVILNNSPGKINFSGYDPTTQFNVGDTITISTSNYEIGG